MDSLLTLQHCRRSLHLPVDHFSIAPASFRSRLHIASASFKSSSSSVRSSFTSPPSSSDSFRQTPRRRKPSSPQIPDPISSSILKTTCVTFAAASALFLMRVSGKPAIAAPNPPLTVESEEESTASEEEKERVLEDQLSDNPNNVKVLRALMAVRFRASKLPGALINVNRLIELEPNELKWKVWRGYVFEKMGDSKLARNEFERVLEKDPCRFRPYQGLVLLTSSSETDALEAIVKRVEGTLEKYKGRIGKWDVRRFKLLIANTKFLKGSYSEALNDIKELEREDPMDFNQHYLLGTFYEALGMLVEADKQYEICEGLLPNHPNISYLGVDTSDSEECKN